MDLVPKMPAFLDKEAQLSKKMLTRHVLGHRFVGVVRCCAHVASVLWFMGYLPHNPSQTKTLSLGYADTLQDAATGWSSDDSASESEKEI
ncbi:hypothetical protein TNCV_1070371 [Trichonephila clavipes]|nr:hypothetical protein TNCV_1070371 [Trichonephila clavipes]